MLGYRNLVMKNPIAFASLLTVAAAACSGGLNSSVDTRQATPITLQFHNTGLSTVYVFQSCLLDFTITSLADPVHQITREGACACDCGQATCPVCGPCFAGARDVAVGSMLTDTWNTVNVTTEPTAIGGSCERRTTLPDGPYRIDIAVYPTAEDAVAHTYGRTATQSFSLPVTGNLVDVQLGASP
jgi:hypothetical protein